MARIALIGLALMFGAGGVAGQGAGGQLSVEVGTTPLWDGARLSVAGGASVSVPFVLENRSAEPLSLRDSLALPDGWVPLGGGGPFEVAPGDRAVRLGLFHVPPGADVRDYVLSYQVAGDAVVEVVIQARVPRVLRLTAVGLAMPGLAESGGPFEAAFTVRNEGNVPTWAYVAGSASGAAVVADSARYRLGPGETRAVPLRVTPRATGGGLRAVSLRARVDVDADGDGRPDGGGTPFERGLRTSVGTTFLSSPARSVGFAYHRYPGSVAVRAFYADRSSASAVETGAGAQLVSSGGGPLREGAATSLRYALRTPTGDVGGYGDRFGLYQVRLVGPSVDAVLGDGSVRLSPLLLANGFGAGALASVGRFGVGALALTGRRSFFAEDYAGGRVSVGVGPATVGINALARRGRIEGEVGSVDVGVTRGAVFQVQAEAGLGRRPGGYATAFGGEGQLRARRFRANFAFQDVGGYVPTSAANRLRARFSTTWNGPGDLRLRIQGDHSRAGTILDPASPRDRVVTRSRAEAEWGRAWSLAVAQRDSESGASLFGREVRERFAEAEARLRLGRLTLNPGVRAGEIRTTLAEVSRTDALIGADLGVQYGAGEHLRVGGSAGATRRPSTSFQTLRPRWTYRATLRADVELSEAVRLYAGANGSLVDDDQSFQFIATTAGASVRLPWGHEVAASATYQAGRLRLPALALDVTTRQAVAEVRYTVPFALRLHRSRRTGVVEGVVRSPAGIGVPQATVFVDDGRRRIAGAMTDSLGQFAIPRIPAGPVFVQLGPSATGTEFFVEGGARVPLVVRGGERSRLAFEASESAALRVRVLSYEGPEEDPERGGARPLPGVRLAIAGPDTVRAVTGYGGHASVTRLRAGTYEVVLVSMPLGARLYGPPVRPIVVGPGDIGEVTVYVWKPSATVQFIDAPPLELVAPPSRGRPRRDN